MKTDMNTLICFIRHVVTQNAGEDDINVGRFLAYQNKCSNASSNQKQLI